MSNKSVKGVQAILVMRSGRMGDFLVTVPALSALRRGHPDALIVLLMGASSDARIARHAESYGGLGVPPWVEWFHPKLFDEVVSYGNWRSPRDWWRLGRKLGAYDFSDIFMLPYYGEKPFRRWQKQVWIRSLGIRGRIHARPIGDEGSRPAGLSLNAWAPLDVVRSSMGAREISGLSEWPRIGPAADAFAEDYWREHNLSKGAVAALFPSGTFAHKIWPASRFAVVAQWLASRGVKVLIVGGNRDRSISDQVAGLATGVRTLNLTGETTLSQLAAILMRCSLFVGNDGGPAHLAAMLNVRCVTVMSGVHVAGMWDPSGEGNTAVRHPTSCYNCRSEFGCPTGTRDCIEGITLEDVTAACEKQLKWVERLAN